MSATTDPRDKAVQHMHAIGQEINALWNELHQNGVDWRPTAMRLLKAHDAYLKAAADVDWWQAQREKLFMCRGNSGAAEEFVNAQRERLRLVSGANA